MNRFYDVCRGMCRKSLLSVIVLFSLFLGLQSAYAQKAGSAQQIAVAKTLKPGIASIGIFCSTLDDKAIETWTRAGMTLGVKVFIAKPTAMGEIAGLYHTLVKEKGVQIILIPDAGDELMTGMGFEYLRQSALSDQVGIFAPQEAMVTNGAFCCVTSEAGKLKVFVNQRIAQVIGANVPSDATTTVTYVVR